MKDDREERLCHKSSRMRLETRARNRSQNQARRARSSQEQLEIEIADAAALRRQMWRDVVLGIDDQWHPTDASIEP